MKFFKYILVLGLLLPSFAQAGGYLGSGKIEVFQNAFGGWIMKTSGANNNPDSCSNSHAILGPGHGQYQEIYSLLLAAYTAGKVVNISVNGCHPNGYKKLAFVYTSNWGG